MRFALGKFLFVFILSSFVASQAMAQEAEALRGTVFTTEASGEKTPLVGANVHWEGTTVGTATDASGFFQISRIAESSHLVVRFIGFRADTILITNQQDIKVELRQGQELDAVEIARRNKSTTISTLATRKTETLSQKELQKAACCNLSESFETSPSVDVSFTDAVTGTRQIQMLGLAGVYTQITRENMPDVRGLAAISGLTYIPGTWVRSIQLNKGAGSVVNGFESTTGQINTELHREAMMDRFFLNVYLNNEERMELNLHTKHMLGKRLSTVLLLHGSRNQSRMDHNDDGFLDMPLSNSFIAFNRYELANDLGMHIEFGGKYTYLDKLGGQYDFKGPEHIAQDSLWGMQIKENRGEGWAKFGRVHKLKAWQSTALQMSAVYHDKEASFGINEYTATQRSFYANLIHQGYLTDEKHQFKTGLSWQYDRVDEELNKSVYDREESVPGAFFEYNWKPVSKFDLLAGLRYDQHNIFGGFVTPRVHIRWEMSESIVLRASGGRGQRTAYALAENLHLLASSRELVIQSENADQPYGLDAEVAWNYGLNLTKCFKINYKEGSVSLDLYRTHFENQIVVNLDASPRQAIISNLNGESFANSFQIQADYELIKRLDVRLAYRFFDVRTTYNGELEQKPFVAQHRSFLNLAYGSRKKWAYDLTVNWHGEKRIPDLSANPVAHQRPQKSPDFFTVNAQISKEFREMLDVYVGVENLFDYKQENPIIDATNPFGNYFDSSMIWGPVFGRKIYLGIRYKLQ